MTERERFAAVMEYRPVDQLPVYYFGTWPETKARWHAEGLETAFDRGRGSGGPQLDGMDQDWETSPDGRGCIWDNQGMLNPRPLAAGVRTVVREDGDTQLVRSPLGGLERVSLLGSSIPQQLEPDLRPTRADWERFRAFLDPGDRRRRAADWSARGAALRSRTRMTCFLGGSLYGWLRGWMGLEGISLLMYDDPPLFAEMVRAMADYFLALNAPLLDAVDFDLAYFFEDCCGSSGPLLSTRVYREVLDEQYRRMIETYRRAGVRFALIDSDGRTDPLLPLWLDSGFDVVFPVEVGTWRADPVALRERHGRRLRIMGGVDKHVIPRGDEAVRRHLAALLPLARDGGFVPMPDHRIPPDCSLARFRRYLEVFRETFG